MSLQELYTLMETQLSARSKTLATLVSHGTSIGTVNEIALGSLLRSYVPKRFEIGSGFVLSDDDTLSKQVDILIYNAQDFPPLFREDDLVVICPEALHAVIEIKTAEQRKFLEEALANIASSKKIKPDIFAAVLFLHPPAELETARKHFEEIEAAKRPATNLLPQHISYLEKWTARWEPASKSWLFDQSGENTLFVLLNTLLLHCAKSDVLERYATKTTFDRVGTAQW